MGRKKNVDQKTRDLVGCQAVKPMDNSTANKMHQYIANSKSAKKQRVNGYMNSNGMRDSLIAGEAKGLVLKTDPHKSMPTREDFNKPVWTPKTSLRWFD